MNLIPCSKAIYLFCWRNYIWWVENKQVNIAMEPIAKALMKIRGDSLYWIVVRFRNLLRAFSRSRVNICTSGNIKRFMNIARVLRSIPQTKN